MNFPVFNCKLSFIFSCVLGNISSFDKFISERWFFVTKQKWHGLFKFDDLNVKQNVEASGQSAIITETFGKNQ